jgi:hypothetical protein
MENYELGGKTRNEFTLVADLAADESTVNGSCEDVNRAELAWFRSQWWVFVMTATDVRIP